MLFQVKERYPKGNEAVIAKFNRQNDAKLFIERKLAYDAQMNVSVHYFLYEGMDLIEEFAAGASGSSTTTTTTGAASGGSQQASGFRPNPLQTTLRPSGFPPASSSSDDKSKN